MKHRLILTAMAALTASASTLVLNVPPATAAAPSAPASCSAVAASGGGYMIEWERPGTTDSPVFRYAIRAKGQVDPTVQLKVDRGTDNPDRSYLWTETTAGASSPLTFMVRATNESGVGAWCEAQVGTPHAPPPPPNVTPSGIEERVGVRVFPQYASATYGNHEAVLDTLGRLGVDRVSGLLTPGMSSEEIVFYQEAYRRHGIEVWFAVGKPGTVLTAAQWTRVRDLLSGPLRNIVVAASGWNEPNKSVGTDWASKTAVHQAALWTNVQQVNATTGQDIKVGTPPLWSGSISQQFTDLASLAPRIQGKYDLINWHMYPHGTAGEELAAMIDTQVAKFRAAYGNLPMLNSESGYFTATNYSGGSNPSTHQSQADEIDDLVNMHLARGVDISYFELLDDPDPTDANREANFGLVETPTLSPSTWVDKPAFTVFQTLTD